MNEIIISIDGRAGSGKEKISKYISKKYNFFHLDSGVLYRRLAYYLFKKKINYSNEKSIKNYLNSINSLSPRNHKCLRKKQISKLSSNIATIPLIRKKINSQQKKIVKEKLKKHSGCVIDGRDIGSKVFRNARIKLFIEAKIEIRAKRRHKQLIEQGEKSIYGEILKEIKLRDKKDSQRKESPLVIPSRAILIDNSNSFKETVIQIKSALKNL